VTKVQKKGLQRPTRSEFQEKASPLVPKGGLWPDDFSKKNPLSSIFLFNNVPWWRRSAAPERLMQDLAKCMLWSTGSVDVYINTAYEVNPLSAS
jgi:hypothetical protein